MNLKKWQRLSSGEDFGRLSLSDRLLELRGLPQENWAAFKQPSFTFDANMEDFVGYSAALDLLKSAIHDSKTICIYSDYDVDGTSAAAILLRCFKTIAYDRVFNYVPNRFDEGYGLNEDAIDYIAGRGADLIITVDCGIRAILPIERAREHKMQVLLTDHHSLPETLPRANVILNPKLSKPSSEHYHICGAAVALYLALGILGEQLGNVDLIRHGDLIQLAALATVCDLVPLIGSSREIAAFGIELMRRNPIAAVSSLMRLSNANVETLDEYDLGFRIGPRINAAGRMQSADIAIMALTTDNIARAETLARDLDLLNTKRKDSEEFVLTQAHSLINSEPIHSESGMIVVWGGDWHEGVLGIAASRLVDSYRKPAIVFSNCDGVYKGSARSVSGFSIYKAIESAQTHLTRFGGHDMACGLSLVESKLPEFLGALVEYCEGNLKEEHMQSSLKIAFDIEPKDITSNGIDEISSLKPFGMGNPKPLFRGADFSIASTRFVGKNKDALKLLITKNNRVFDGIMFGAKDYTGAVKSARVDMAFLPSHNVFNGVSKVQCSISDVRIYNPKAGDLQAQVFAHYSKRLLGSIIENDGEITLLNAPSINSETLVEMISSGQRVGVNSYESLLDAVYTLFDYGYLLSEILARNCFQDQLILFPSLDDGVEVYYGNKGIYGSDNKDRQAFYRYTILSQLEFDRTSFGNLYLKLKSLGSSSITKLLCESEAPINTMLALMFFSESKFVNIVGDDVVFISGQHSRVEYSNTKISKSIDKFYLSL